MLDSLSYKIQDGKLVVTVVGNKNVLKAIYTSEVRPWVNIGRADITEIIKLIEKRLRELK